MCFHPGVPFVDTVSAGVQGKNANPKTFKLSLNKNIFYCADTVNVRLDPF